MRRVLFGPIVRLVPAGLVFLGIQRTVAADHPVDGVVLQVVLALVVGVGAGAGAQYGALAGFLLGGMYDLGVGTPLGLTSLAYGLAGITAGYVLAITPDPQWWLASLFACLGAAVGELALPVGKMVTGVDGWLTPDLVRVVSIVALGALVLSPLMVPLGRWCVAVKRPKWKVMTE
jgi:cell shape-determining protein MreD